MTEELKNSELQQNKPQINHWDNQLLDATQTGDMVKFKEALENGAHPNCLMNTNEYNGYTPLHHAAAGGHMGMVRILVEKGANIHAEIKPANGFGGACARIHTPADLARFGGYNDIANTLENENIVAALRNKNKSQVATNEPEPPLRISTFDLEKLEDAIRAEKMSLPGFRVRG